MGFEDDKIDDFIAIFEHAKEKIRSFDGCEFLDYLLLMSMTYHQL